MPTRPRSAQDGFTLPEVLVVLAIIGIVLAGITQMFASATKSANDQTRRVDAQQDARVALDQLRRDIHCGTTLTYSANSVTVTLPSYCPSAPKTTLSSSVTLPSASVAVASTKGFNSGTNTVSFGSSGTVTCTGKTSTSFTGCSGGTAGTYASGTAVASPVTWCATTTSPPYVLKRYAAGASVAGAACNGAGGVATTKWLVSSSVFTSFTRPPALVSAPSFAVGGGGMIQPGTYWYDVTAVTPNGEFSGTPTSTAVSSGSTNSLTLSWTAYTDPSGAAPTGYRIYGRDNGSTTAQGFRLLGTVGAGTTSFTDNGAPMTTLTGAVTLPAVTIPVADTSAFTWSPNTIQFASSGTVTCTGKTSTSFTGCSGGASGSYLSGTAVSQVPTSSSPVGSAPPLATLNVSLVVDETPADNLQRFTLNDAISLRNSGRF